MNLNFQSSVIIAKDIELLKSFYSEILHLEIELDFGACVGFKGGFSLWQLSESYPISKHLGYTYSNSKNQNLELCFETDEFEHALENILKHNLKLLHNVTKEPWGQKTIRFYDPEDNLIEVGESMTCFVKRFHNKGLCAT